MPLFTSMAQTSVAIKSCSDSISQLHFDINVNVQAAVGKEESEKLKPGFNQLNLGTFNLLIWEEKWSWFRKRFFEDK